MPHESGAADPSPRPSPAEQRGWSVIELYADNGVSGSKGRDKRPTCSVAMDPLRILDLIVTVFVAALLLWTPMGRQYRRSFPIIMAGTVSRLFFSL